MGLEGFYNLGGLEMEKCYVHINRFQTRINYTPLGDSNTEFLKYLVVDYDYAIFKDKATSLNNPTQPIKVFTRNRFSYQLIDGGMDDIWQLVYDDIGRKELFRDFLPDEE